MKNFLQITIAFTLLLFCNSIQAQVSPAIQWEKCYGGSDGEGAWSIQQTTDGGFIVAGESISNDYDVSGNHGAIDYFGDSTRTLDYWIVRLDTTGKLVWQKSLGGSDGDFAYSVQQTTDGGFIVAGWSESNDGDVSANQGYDDYWIVKIDTMGNLQWQKDLGGGESDEANSIQQTADGGCIVAGWSSSTNGDVTGNHGYVDFWVVKLDEVGNLVWRKCLGGSGDDRAESIQQITDGGYIVAGWTNSNNGDIDGWHEGYDNYGNPTTDATIMKLDAGGNLVWQKCLGGSNDEQANSIQQTTDGGFIVAGFSASNDGDATDNHSDSTGNHTWDYWIVRLDSAGNLVWQKSLGGSGLDYITSIQQTIDGGFIAAGQSSSNDGDVSGNHGFGDYWIVKLDVIGNLTWQKCLGGSNNDYAFSIQQTTDGGYIVAGSTPSPNDGDVSGNHQPYLFDYWIVKLGSDPLVGISFPWNNFISVFPNPVQTELNINLGTPTNKFIICVYDVQGRIISLPISFQSEKAQLNTENLPDGFYTIQITNNKTGVTEVGKFVKQY